MMTSAVEAVSALHRAASSGTHMSSVWWSSDHDYKNTVTNGLFMHLSAALYLRTGTSSYLDNAKKVRIHQSCLPFYSRNFCRPGTGVRPHLIYRVNITDLAHS